MTMPRFLSGQLTRVPPCPAGRQATRVAPEAPSEDGVRPAISPNLQFIADERTRTFRIHLLVSARLALICCKRATGFRGTVPIVLHTAPPAIRADEATPAG
jgi:hypothetical protein